MMKRLVKSAARRAWRWTSPVRRPASRKATAFVAGVIEPALREEVHPRLDHLVRGQSILRTEVGTYRNETNLLLDSLVREVSRLQDQVETLQGLLIESLDARNPLGVMGHREDKSSAA
jgi:hypothetical protein